jgi:red chlorophyll catabolite reductase
LCAQIDFVLGSWLNCALPFGELNIATLIAMLGPEADSPHLLFEFIQSGLVSNPDYLTRYYENSPLETIRQRFEKHPHTQPYLTSALYVRSVVSPTALLYKVSGDGAEGGLDGVITELVQPAAAEVVETWVECYRNLGQALEGDAIAAVQKRDELIKSKGVEVDLSANMPRLFGQEIADRVVAAFRKGV